MVIEKKHLRWLVSCRDNGLSVVETHELLLCLESSGDEGRKNAQAMLEITTTMTEEQFQQLK